MQQTSELSPHGSMRRKEREISSRTEIDAIIQSSTIMHVALAENNIPFVVPVFYAYDGVSLFFHSAQSGSKIEIMKRNPNVCFEISVAEGVIESDTACDFEAKHRTVIGFGTTSFIEAEAEKIDVLNLIVARFSPKKFLYPSANLNNTAVIRIAIASIKGKMHGY